MHSSCVFRDIDCQASLDLEFNKFHRDVTGTCSMTDNKFTKCAVFSLSLLALLATQGCIKKKHEKKQVPLAVFTQKATRRLIEQTLTYSTTLRGSTEVRVFSQIPDRIRALNVDVGDRVKKGQLIAVIDHNMLSSGLAAALASQNSARAQLEQLRSEYARVVKLYKAQAVGQAQLDRLESQVQAAEASVNRLQAMVNQAESQQGRAFVRSPIDGVVGQRFLEEGDLALPQVPIVTVVQMDELKAELKVPEFELPLVESAKKNGFPVRVSTYASLVEDAKAMAARIVRISPTIDLATRMASVEIRLDNKEHVLKPGMLAEVGVVVRKSDKALVIPQYAVLNRGAVGASGGQITHVVFTVEEGKAKEHEVRLGLLIEAGEHGKALAEVTRGLKEGDEVVIRGQHLLKDGQSVKVIQAPPLSGGVEEDGGKQP